MEHFDNVQVSITGYFGVFQKCIVQFDERGIRIEIRADWQLTNVVPRLKENLLIDIPYTDIDSCVQRVGSMRRLQAQIKLNHHNAQAPSKIALAGKPKLFDAFRSHGVPIAKPSPIATLLYGVFLLGLIGALVVFVAFLSTH